MVKNLSALLCLKQESRYPIDEDHTNMVKFAVPVDKNYESVVRHIKECMESHSKARCKWHPRSRHYPVHELDVYLPVTLTSAGQDRKGASAYVE